MLQILLEYYLLIPLNPVLLKPHSYTGLQEPHTSRYRRMAALTVGVIISFAILLLALD